jgi:hypothetical protein
MSDIELQDAGEAIENQPALPDVSEVAKEMIAQMKTELGSTMPMTPAQQRRESQTEKYVAELLEKGASKEGIDVVLNLLKRYETDREAERYQQNIAMAEDEFHRALWSQAEKSLAPFKSSIPGFNKVAPGLVQEISELVRSDKEFKGMLSAINKGALPEPDQWEKVANKAVNSWLDEAGIKRKSAPIDLKSAKPKTDVKDEFDSQGLDDGLHKLYLAVKNATGDEKKARAAVENTRRARRG